MGEMDADFQHEGKIPLLNEVFIKKAKGLTKTEQQVLSKTQEMLSGPGEDEEHSFCISICTSSSKKLITSKEFRFGGESIGGRGPEGSTLKALPKQLAKTSDASELFWHNSPFALRITGIDTLEAILFLTYL